MLDKWIAPVVVGLVVAFFSLFGSDVKELILPDFEVTYKIAESKKLIGPQDVGRKLIPILDKSVSDVYLSQFELKNTGKQSIKDIEFLLDIYSATEPELYRVFYVTQPREMFGPISFSDYKTNLSKKIKLMELIEGNSITVSFISSEPLSIDFISNMAKVNFREFKKETTLEDHTYVAVISALSVLIGRILIDFFGYLVSLYRNRTKRED